MFERCNYCVTRAAKHTIQNTIFQTIPIFHEISIFIWLLIWLFSFSISVVLDFNFAPSFECKTFKFQSKCICKSKHDGLSACYSHRFIVNFSYRWFSILHCKFRNAKKARLHSKIQNGFNWGTQKLLRRFKHIISNNNEIASLIWSSYLII